MVERQKLMRIKKKTLGIGMVAIVVAACVVFVSLSLWGTQTQTVLTENQSYVYAYVSSITGNEITYTELEESVVTAYLEQQAAEETAQEAEEDVKTENESGDRNMEDAVQMQTDGEASGENSGGELPSGEGPSGETDGELSSGEAPSGELPSGEAPNGELPSGEAPSGEAPSGELSAEDGRSVEDGMPSMGGGSGGDSGMMSTESVTTLIPVGVTVHTQSDMETTFGRLASGDMIKMLVETTENGEEVITEIWML